MLVEAIFSTFDFVTSSMHLCEVKFQTVLFLLLLTAFGCGTAENSANTPLYFDLPGFFTAELNRQHGRAIRARVSWEKDGEKEIQQDVLVDWNKAFSALKKLDMNKAAYRGNYRCDTLLENGRQQIRYQALGKTVNPKTVVVQFDSGKVSRLELTTADKNFLYNSEVHYSYVPDDTLRISGTQEVIFGKKHNYQRSYWY